jgi:hypothetical protein
LDINFKEALATIFRAMPLVLFRAGIFVAGGLMAIIFFGMAFFALRLAGNVSSFVAIVIIVLAILGVWAIGRVLQCFLLYRHRAAMLLLFSRFQLPAAGLSTVLREAGRSFPNHSRWATLNRSLRRSLSAFYRVGKEFPEQTSQASGKFFAKALNLLAAWPIGQAILTLAFSRSHTDMGRSATEALAIYFQHGKETRRLAYHWLLFSAAGLIFLFLCLALPNWFFFKSANVPVWIGIILATAIAWLLHQAFVVPFVLAGVCGALLAETGGKTPDQNFCEKLGTLIPGMVWPAKELIDSATDSKC